MLREICLRKLFGAFINENFRVPVFFTQKKALIFIMYKISRNLGLDHIGIVVPNATLLQNF